MTVTLRASVERDSFSASYTSIAHAESKLFLTLILLTWKIR